MCFVIGGRGICEGGVSREVVKTLWKSKGRLGLVEKSPLGEPRLPPPPTPMKTHNGSSFKLIIKNYKNYKIFLKWVIK